MWHKSPYVSCLTWRYRIFRCQGGTPWPWSWTWELLEWTLSTSTCRNRRILRYSPHMKPSIVLEELLTSPLLFYSNQVPSNKLRYAVRRIRRSLIGTYEELTVSGLWEPVANNAFYVSCEEYVHKICRLNTIDSCILRVRQQSNMHVFSSTCLLRCSLRIQRSDAPSQVVADSKHWVPSSNYPISVAGHLDSGVQFRFLSIGVSNKDDKLVYRSFLYSAMNSIQRFCQSLSVSCKQSDNAVPILNTFRHLFPGANVGICLLHLQQNNNKKWCAWNITIPSDIPRNDRTKWIRRRRDNLECQRRDMLNWMASIPEYGLFKLCSHMIMLNARIRGHDEYVRIFLEYLRMFLRIGHGLSWQLEVLRRTTHLNHLITNMSHCIYLVGSVLRSGKSSITSITFSKHVLSLVRKRLSYLCNGCKKWCSLNWYSFKTCESLV